MLTQCRQGFKRNYAKDAHTHARTRTHAHTHTVQNDRGDGQCCLAEIFSEEKCLEFAFKGRAEIFSEGKCLEFAFKGRESSRVHDVLGEIVSDVGGQSVKRCESQGFCG